MPASHLMRTEVVVPPELLEAVVCALDWPKDLGGMDSYLSEAPFDLGSAEVVGGKVKLTYYGPVDGPRPTKLMERLTRERRVGERAWTRRRVSEAEHRDSWKATALPLRYGRFEVVDADVFPDALPVTAELSQGRLYRVRIGGREEAFGTGLHATTGLMLEALSERIRPNLRVLDVGAGTGVLSVAAARAGSVVTAVEPRRQAAAIATRNAALNDVQVQVVAGAVEEADGLYDLILANLTGSILVAEAPEIAVKLKRRGRLIVSGLYTGWVDRVKRAYADQGIRLHIRKVDSTWGNWHCLEGTKR